MQLVISEKSVTKDLREWLKSGIPSQALVTAKDATSVVREGVRMVKAHGLPVSFHKRAVEQALTM